MMLVVMLVVMLVAAPAAPAFAAEAVTLAKAALALFGRGNARRGLG
jgi:hypothetical protein